jgi:hypothetical protein
MATYKPRQRVRIVAALPSPANVYIGPAAPETVGCEGTLIGRYIGPGPWQWDMHVDGFGTRVLAVREDEIAPLTDPAAAAFLESIRKMKPYSEPTVKPRITFDPSIEREIREFLND